jgi:hypothetical protein
LPPLATAAAYSPAGWEREVGEEEEGEEREERRKGRRWRRGDEEERIDLRRGEIFDLSKL